MSDETREHIASADCWCKPEVEVVARSARPRRARLTLPAVATGSGRGSFFLGDLDLSRVVGQDITVTASGTEVTTVSVDIPAIDGVEFDGLAILDVRLTNEQQLALIYAGWTPPKGQQ